MITCPLCLNFVESLKSNSHIIPRHAIIPTKESGKNVKIDLLNGVIKRNQQDSMADIVCSGCEKKFSNDDAFAKDFMVHELYVPLSTQPENKGVLRFYNSIGDNLVKLALGICIRQHLKSGILGSRYRHMRKIYTNEVDLYSDFRIWVCKMPNTMNSVAYPHIFRFEGYIYLKFVFLNYVFFVGTDRRGFHFLPEEYLVSREQQVIAELSFNLIDIAGLDSKKISTLKNLVIRNPNK